MDLTFLAGLGAFAKENGVALLCLIALAAAVWRGLSWTANNVILPVVTKLLHLFDVAETVFLAMGHDLGDLKTSGCGLRRAEARNPTDPPPTPTLQLTTAH